MAAFNRCGGALINMTIDIPEDLERFVHDEVLAGRYKTEDEAVCAAQEQLRKRALGSLGAMRDAGAELDEIVEHAMKRREQRWGPFAGRNGWPPTDRGEDRV
jgi:Arc/MetJ-type ribon-helix-helix transcriptional regulator